MLTLRQSRFEELELFRDIAAQSHARNFVLQTDLETHQQYFNDDTFHYLTIETEQGVIAGYFILVLDEANKEVEFGRICLDQNQRGIGQQAIRLMEDYCRTEFAADKIWLDVFEDNPVGIHIYEKLGYRRFKQEEFQGRQLLFYRKLL